MNKYTDQLNEMYNNGEISLSEKTRLNKKVNHTP